MTDLKIKGRLMNRDWKPKDFRGTGGHVIGNSGTERTVLRAAMTSLSKDAAGLRT